MGDYSRAFNGFDHKSIRAAFVSKVFSIVAVQLLLATAMIAWFTLHEPTKQYFKHSGSGWIIGAAVISLVALLILSCIESARRSFPINFLLLTIITIGYGLMAAVLSSQYETTSVLCAFGATAFATIVILLLAKFSPVDMTTCGCGLCILAIIHLVTSILLIAILVPMGYGNTVHLAIAGMGAFLVSLYMLYDLQLIMGGRSNELSPEEYVLAAVMLYIDIIQLFQYMLILLGDRS